MKRIQWIVVFFAGTAVVLAGLYAGISWYLEREAAAEIAGIVRNSHIIREFGYQRLRVSPLDRVMTLSDVSTRLTFAADPVRIDRIRLKNQNGTPDTEVHEMAVTGIHLPAEHSSLRDIRPLLSEMGYESVTANLECRISRDRTGNRVNMEKVVFEVIDAGRLEIALDMRGISAAGLERAANSPFAALAELQHAAIGFARIAYQDLSLFQRVVSAYSRLMNVSTASVTETMVAQIDQEIQRSSTPSIREALQTLKQFVIRPGFIQVVLGPPEPVSLKDAFVTAMSAGPETWLDLFHVQVSLSPSSGSAAHRIFGQ